MKLDELQRWLLDAIVAPNQTSAQARQTVATAASADEIVVPIATRTAAQRVQIYTSMYSLRLRGVFATDYPGLRGLMDDDAFDHMVRDYLTHYPPRHWGFWDMGAGLAHYFAPQREPPDPLLADMARLEYAIRRAIHVPESAVLTPDALSQIPPEQFAAARFRPANGFRVFAFDHDVNAMFNTIDRGEPVPAERRAPEPAWAAVWRKQMTVWRQAVSRPQYVILDALVSGRPMAEALADGADAWEGDEAELEARIFEWFAGWLGEGFFSEIVLPS